MFKEIDYQKHFVIGTPLVGWKCEKNEHMAWLRHAEEILKKFPNAKFFSAFELDHRVLSPFEEVAKKIKQLNGDYWTYQINDNESKVTHSNRLVRIETGRNLVKEFSQRRRSDAILYVDSDIILEPEIIEKLFEIDHPLVGVNVPQYALKGKVINENPRIEEHWNTAGLLLVNAPAYYDLSWHHNAYRGLSDDPTFQQQAERLKQFEKEETYGMTWVRKDIEANHLTKLVSLKQRNIPNREISN